MRKALFFFCYLNDSDLDWMVSSGCKEGVSAGSVLVREGHDIDTIYVILKGAFTVYLEALGGREIARLMPGEVIGEMSFVTTRPPSATVRADMDSAVLAIPRRPLADKLNSESEFAARFYKALSVMLADRVRGTVLRLGYGRSELDEFDDADELDPDILEHVSLAGARFDWLRRRLDGLRSFEPVPVSPDRQGDGHHS